MKSKSESIYNEYTMKANHFFALTAILLAFLTLLLTFVNFNPPAALAKDSYAHQAAPQQPVPAAQQGDDSEVGSTDGILVMGVVIVLIVTLPLIIQKRK